MCRFFHVYHSFVCRFLFSVLLIFFIHGATAQTYFQFSSNTHRATIPFKFYRNLIIVPVIVNGHGPYNFVLDSGVGISTITDPDLIGELNLQLGKKITIRGLGDQQPAVAYLSSGIIVAMQSVQSFPFTMAVFEKDPFFLSTYLGIKVEGILGFEFFNSFSVKINYLNKTISLFPPGNYNPPGGYTAVPITLQLNKPFIKAVCEINENQNVPIDLLVDIGAGFPLSLEKKSDSRITVPALHIETQLGMGLSGIIHGSLARIQKLEIAGFKFKNIVTSFPDFGDWQNTSETGDRNGSIGNFLLRRFTVVFDYQNSKLYLKPNSQYRAAFVYDRTGIELVGGGDDYSSFVVSNVKQNSPASEAGIHEDDIVLEVNFQPVKNFDLGGIDHILSDPGSKGVWLKLRRGEEDIYVLIKMRDLI